MFDHMKKWKTSFLRLFNNKKEIIDDETYSNNLEEILEYIVFKIEKEYVLYQNLLNQIKDLFKLNDSEKLKIDEKEQAIIEMFKLLKCNSACANLKFLKANDRFGRCSQKNISKSIIINQSTTGLWKKYYEF